MKTSSILESIRNKINKIEKNNTETNPVSSDDHDDFEYIDDQSKDIVNSKHSSANTIPASSSTNSEQPNPQATDDDFDFLNGDEEDPAIEKHATMPPVKAEVILPTSSKDDLDLDLENLELDEEIDKNSKPTAASSYNKKDDLDLENLELDEELDNQASVAASVTLPPAKPSSADDLDLENLDLDEELNTPISASAPKPPVQSNIVSPQSNDLDLDMEVEEENFDKNNVLDTKVSPKEEDLSINSSPSEPEASAPAPVQNNYQETRISPNNMNQRTSIISEDIARKTSNSIREMMQSVPRTQNHQYLQNNAPAFKSGETIEDMVSAILAPKLEQWINENLPPMVEKIVKSEIKRLMPHDEV